MDPVLLHIRLNHFPLIMGIVGAVAVVIAIVTKRSLFLRYAQISLLIAGAFAPVAFFTGRAAEESVEHEWYAQRDVVHEHEEAGEKAAIALAVTGIIAGLSLWKQRRALQVLLLVAALASAGLVTLAGFHGGKIIHENEQLLKR
jgi:uncharacterized membrane protein